MDFPERTFRFHELIEVSGGMVGREIARAIVEARFTAFADGNRAITQEDLLAALREVIPVSVSHKETIERLRRWKTEGRARPASSDEPPPAASLPSRHIDV